MHRPESHSQTTASMIAELRTDGRVRTWTCLGNPCCGVYVPGFGATVAPELADPAQWQRFARLRDAVEADPDRLAGVRAACASVETDLWAQADAAFRVRRAADDSTGSPLGRSRRSTRLCIDSASEHPLRSPRADERSHVNMEFNVADLLERVADTVPDHLALVCGPRRLTFADLEARANRLAHALTAHGVGAGDHVALYLYNSTEYLEGMLAAFKIRAVPINVNYRYVEDELRYLLDDADAVAVIFHREFAPKLAAIRPSLPLLRTFIAVDDDSPRPDRTPRRRRLRASRSPPRRPSATSRHAPPTTCTCSTPAAPPACRRA